MRKQIILCLLVLLCVGRGYGQSYYISTVACPYSFDPDNFGDGGLAILGSSEGWSSIAFDSYGNLYFTDAYAAVVRKVSTTGIITTIAGSYSSYSPLGDGGPASAAKLWNPQGIAIDASNNIYICDAYNNRIRMIDHYTGTITTIAGDGTAGFSGDGGSASAAQINQPHSITIDASGNIYFADFGNHRIRRIASGIISTIAGDGSTGGYISDGYNASSGSLELSYFSGLTTDGSGNVYFSSYSASNGGAIRMIDHSTSHLTTITNEVSPAFAFDASGNLIFSTSVTGSAGCYVKKITSGSVNIIAGTSPVYPMSDNMLATSTGIYTIFGLAINASGNIFISSTTPGYTPGGTSIRRLSTEAPPYFVNGPSQSLTVCQGSSASLNALLTAADASSGETLTWSVLSGPSHGSVSASYTAGSGSTVIPTGLSYNPTTGYVGSDVFTIQITDGIFTATTTINVSVGSTSAAAAIGGTTNICLGSSSILTDATLYGTWSSSNSSVADIDANTGEVFGNAVGTATITYNNGCGTPATTTVNVSDVAAPISGATRVCVGSNIYLTNATPGGTWSSSAPTKANINSSGMVHGVANGVTTISYTVTNSCGTTYATSVVYVGVYLPPIDFGDTGRIMCRSMPRTFTNAVSGGTWSSANSWATVDATTGVVTGTTSTSASSHPGMITYTAPTGCGTGMVTVPIRIKGFPTTTNGLSAEKNICTGAGENISIEGSPQVTGYNSATWTPVSPSIAVVSTIADYKGLIQGISAGSNATTFTFHYSKVDDSSICQGDAMPIRINVVNKPVITLTGTTNLSTSGCAGPTSSAISLTGTSGTFSWTPATSAVCSLACTTCGSNTIYALSPGSQTYTVTKTGYYWCLNQSTADITINVNPCKSGSGVNDMPTGAIQIYPNPTSGIFTVDLPASTSSCAITITDITGKTISTRISAREKEDFDLSTYPKGIYLIQVETDDKKYNQKIVLE